MNEEKGCDCKGEKTQISCHDQQQCETPSSPSPSPVKLPETKRAKSCKGTLYYSSILKSKSKNPLCIGISHSLPKVPDNIMFDGESKGRSLTDFRHICAGYSVYVDNKGTHPTGATQTPRSELPLCVGLELLIDRKLTEHQAPTHAQAHTQEDRRVIVVSQPQPQPQPQPQKTTPGEEYMTKFARNAGLVASGVYKNMRKVGNYIKANIDDTLFKRPK